MSSEYRSSRECAFFAASNSRVGFHSYYERVFRGSVDQLYCIKGGPGTGKSTLMRRVAREGERRGYRVESYYCSSDADSLDAVLLFGAQGSIGLLDATAPHAFEPSLPGVSEHWIDLGQFWNCAALSAREHEILVLNTKKREGYRSAYHYLAAAGEVAEAATELALPCIDEGKWGRTVRRLVGKEKMIGGHGRVQIGLCDSVGMSGQVRLSTYLSMGERVCLIEDAYGIGYALLRAIGERVSEAGADVKVSYHPVLPDRMDALYIEQGQTVFMVCAPDEMEQAKAIVPQAKCICAQKLMRPEAVREVRGRLRLAARLERELIAGAVVQLKTVSDAHFALEDIYMATMDFEAKEEYTERFCRTLFGEE